MGYKAFYRHKEIEVPAESSFEAWEKTIELLKVPENKLHLVMLLSYENNVASEDEVNSPIVKFKIKSLGIKDTEFKVLPFGRKTEYFSKIRDWKKDAKVGYVSQKRTPYRKAIKEFLELNNVKEYYCSFHCAEWYKDDSFEIFYKAA